MSVLLVDPFSSGADYPDILRAADVRFFTVRTRRAVESGQFLDDPIPPLMFDNVDNENIGELVDFCKVKDVNRVISGTESAVPFAEYLKIELGLGAGHFNDKGSRFWDKDVLYETLSLEGVRVPKRVALVSNSIELEKFDADGCLDSFGVVVVKPDVGAGSVNVRTVRQSDELVNAIDSILGSKTFFGESDNRALVQEFVVGREYVVDTVSASGRHKAVAVCTYDKHPSSSGSMVYDRLRWLEFDDPTSRKLVEYVGCVLDSLGHIEGSMHIEVIVDDNGPCIIDLGARPHGAGHPMKTHVLTGSSQIHLECGLAAGEPVSSSRVGYELRQLASIEFFSVPAKSRVSEDFDPAMLLACEGVIEGFINAEPASIHEETHSLLDGEKLGLVFVTGSDENRLSANAARVRSVFSSQVREF